MIFGQSIKSVLRTPLKTILFILLIAAVTAFACLGFGMLNSGNRLIKAADETYTTKAVIEYIDEGYPDPGRYSSAMVEELTRFDRSVLSDNENVLSYETKYDVGGYIEGYRSKTSQNAFGNYGVIRFGYREVGEFGQIVVHEVYYSGDNSFHANSLLYVSRDLGLVEGHEYIAHGKFTKQIQSSDTFVVAAYTNSGAHDDSLFKKPVWDITSQLENDQYKQAEKYSLFSKIVESYIAMNNFVNVELTKDVKFATQFLLQQTSLLDDGFSRFFTEEEYDSSARVIIVSSYILSRLDKNVGDTVNVGLYAVNPDGSFARKSFWPDTSFAERGEYTIVGVFKETTGLNDLAFIPMPKGAESWLPDNSISYIIGNVLLKNGTAEQYIQDVQPHLLDAMRISIYDQGYSQTIAPLLAIRETAVLLSAVSAVCCLVVLILFAYLFVAKQKDTASIMVSLGAGKHRALAYLLFCVLIIAFVATAGGAYAGYRLSENVTKTAYAQAEQNLVIDNSFSAVYMSGDNVEFDPDFKPDILPIVLVACAVITAALIISLIVSSSAITRSTPKTAKSHGEGLRRAAFAFGLALKSIFRGGAKNIVVPVASLVLLLFISIFTREIATSSDKLDDVYDNSTVYAYFTTFRGKRLDKLSLNDEQIVNVVNDEHVESVYRSSNLYIKYLGYTKAGTDDWQPIDPDSTYLPPGVELSKDNVANPFVDFDKVIYTESIAHTPEFLFSDELNIEFLEGYSDESFRGDERVCALPSAFLEANGLEFGDEIECLIYIRADEGYETLPIYAKIVASFEKAGSRTNMYMPLYWAKNEYYLAKSGGEAVIGDSVFRVYSEKYLPPDTPQEELDKYDSVEHFDFGRYSYNSIALKLKDLRTLNDFKASLKEWGFSSLDDYGKARIWVVVEDTFLNKSIENINRHITYMKILFTVVYLLAVVIGFVLSYLLTKNRRSELAMMRSMGTGMIRTFGIFLIEQLILSLLGCAVGLGIIRLIYGSLLPLQWLGFAGYIVCYWIGVIISVAVMNKVDVIKLLSSKD